MKELNRQQQLVAELDATAERVDAAIADLSDEQASRQVADGWSAKDHLTHLTYWHEMRFFEMSRIARGGLASFPHTDEKGVEHVNAQIAENRRRLPLSQVVADLQFARDMVKQAVLASPDDRLVPSAFEEIGPNGAGHEMAHAAQIEDWRKKERI